jgi:hypothetical protein
MAHNVALNPSCRGLLVGGEADINAAAPKGKQTIAGRQYGAVCSSEDEPNIPAPLPIIAADSYRELHGRVLADGKPALP